MKNILFYFTWQLKPVHHGIVIEKLQSLVQQTKDAKIYFLVCDGDLKPCYTNRDGKESICSVCKFHTHAALKQFANNIEILYLSDCLMTKQAAAEFTYNSIDDIKGISYKNVSIGYGALSSYISFTRNLEPVMDQDFRTYFNQLLNSQKQLTDVLEDIMSSYNIGQVYFFNGRTADTRPLYDLCKNHSIPFVSLEMIKRSNEEFYINEFTNCLPHDISFHHQRLTDTWNRTDVSETEKINIGSSFFENRRKGILTRDRMVFTTNQVKDMLPANWNPEKRNIAIFNSSEDEFAAIGDIFEKLAVFKKQEEGLIRILTEFAEDKSIHFHLRIHPNLTGIPYDYHKRLYQLTDRFSNITIIPPDSPVSTYKLIDAAETVVVFGSSTGAEACYWGKPVILLAGSFYYHLDVAYKPTTAEESFKLIRVANLQPKPKIEAIKYGYYLMNYTLYTRKNELSPVPLKFAGKSVGLGHHHLRFWGSKLLFRIVEKSIFKVASFTAKRNYPIPTKGH